MGKYFEPADLVKFSGLSVIAKSVVDGFLAGQHPSAKKGVSTDFTEHREYAPGDELKRLDWKVLGKTDRYYIKEYREESTLTCNILLDCSASMGYASGQISKFKYSVYLAAVLSYLLNKQQDKAGLMGFNSKIMGYVAPKAGRTQLKLLLEYLDKLEPAGVTGVANALKEAAGRMKGRGICILISDLYGAQAEIIKHARYLAAGRNEVIVFQVMDPEELELSFKDPLTFEGLEDNEAVLALPDMIREEYLTIIREFTDGYKKAFHGSGIDYVLLSTKTPLEEALIHYLSRRVRVGK